MIEASHPNKLEMMRESRKMKWSSVALVFVVLLVVNLMVMGNESSPPRLENVQRNSRNGINYAEALTKSILFFEGQRSGPLPSSQRMKWRKDSALKDGHDIGIDLVGGYYDAGDNLKFNFPMAFSSTMIAWGVLEFGEFMGSDLKYAREAIKWGTDYFLKSTSIPDVVYVQVGNPYSDHDCWQRPEDMNTDRTAYAVDKDHPGSEVSAEIAAALASASMVFKHSHPRYSKKLLNRAIEVFAFADKYQGNFNDSLGEWVCPFYCDWSGYKDELLWGAAWLYKASSKTEYLSYVIENMHLLEAEDAKKGRSTIGEFGWDNKHAGINVLIGNMLLAANKMTLMSKPYTDFIPNADKFACTVLPESPTRIANYSKGGLLFKSGGSNMQNPAALSFLLVVYARYLNTAKKLVRCENNIVATSDRLITIAKNQVDYILGKNPSNMSYMVGFGDNFPKRIHHRGSSLPSIHDHPEHIKCKDGTPYYESENPNPNYLVGAVVGGPAINDSYTDSRSLFVESEPTTYINAPLVGLFAYFDQSSS